MIFEFWEDSKLRLREELHTWHFLKYIKRTLFISLSQLLIEANPKNLKFDLFFLSIYTNLSRLQLFSLDHLS